MSGVKAEPSSADKFYCKFRNSLEELKKSRVLAYPLGGLRSRMPDAVSQQYSALHFYSQKTDAIHSGDDS